MIGVMLGEDDLHPLSRLRGPGERGGLEEVLGFSKESFLPLCAHRLVNVQDQVFNVGDNHLVRSYG